MTASADVIGIDVVSRGIGEQPTDRGLTVFDRRRKRRFARQAVVETDNDITLCHEVNRGSLFFASVIPTVPVDPENDRQGVSDRRGGLNIELQITPVDPFVNQVAHNICILEIYSSATPLR